MDGTGGAIGDGQRARIDGPGRARRARVAIVINSFDDLHFLPEAIESVLAQTVPADEIIVVDDGSAEDPTALVARYPDVRLIRQTNAGLAAARNTGLAAATSTYVAFLDADDRLLPMAIEAGLACFEATPDSAFVFGGHRLVDLEWRPIGSDDFRPSGDSAYAHLLKGNHVAMHAAVLYKTQTIRDIGGFDGSLRLCEDYDLYLRIARTREIGCHPTVVAEYRRHGANASRRHRSMLKAALDVHRRHRVLRDPLLGKAWKEGRAFWIDHYLREVSAALRLEVRTNRRPRVMASLLKERCIMAVRYSLGARLRHFATSRVKGLFSIPGSWPPKVGRVDLGALDSTRPVSMDFGFDRGLPIDRYYIESFLYRHRSNIAGRVLEIGDDTYSRRFGGARITKQDILHVHAGNPDATLVGELTDPSIVRDDMFDCMVLTQTLHLVFDFRLAIERIHAALKTDGVVLLTVPGITQIDRGEWKDVWYWSFTRASIQRLFRDVFGDANVEVECFGNVYAATLYLQGLSVEEAQTTKLDYPDPAYPVTVAVRARKGA